MLETGMELQIISNMSSKFFSARDLTIEAARDAASARRSSTKPIPPSTLKKLLDSRREADILEGLRRVVTIFYTQSASATLPYFTAVIKNVASTNPEIKKLVYALLIQLSETAPDTALLSVNTIQRGLSDPNAQSRALALRTMSSIRVPVISQIVALGIKRGVVDMSPIVRRTAALAIPKCHRLDPSTAPLLIEQIALLLGDRQYYVVGPAVVAYLDVCPERIDLVHPNYKSIVKKLVDMDEWSQLATLQLMLEYSRRCFPRRTKTIPKNQKPTDVDEFYADDASKSSGNGGDTEQIIVLDPDLELLLDSAKLLLYSRSSAVIIAVARCFLYLGSTLHISQTAGPLMSTLRAAPDIMTQAMTTIVSICQRSPLPFIPYATRFLLSASDPPSIINAKLTIQSILFPHVTSTIRSLLLTDLEHHTRSSDPTTLRAAVFAIGRCAASAPDAALRTKCLRLLLKHLSSPDATLVAASLDEIRTLIQRAPQTHTKTIVRLARHLDALTAPKARAAIVWLVGEHAAAEGSPKVAADVWRILLRDFADETEIVQAQILLLGAKVYLHHKRQHEKEKGKSAIQSGEHDTGATSTNSTEDDGRIERMLEHTFLLARYAHSYALRDRARYFRALILGSPSTDLGAFLLLAEKPLSGSGTSNDTITTSDSNKDQFVVGTASQILGVALRGSEKLPAWTTVAVGAEERRGKTSVGSPETGSSTARSTVPAATILDESASKKANGVGAKSLDEWLNEDDNEEESSEEEEETTEEEEDDEETEEEEETDEEEEEENSNEKGRLIS
jgi:AP-3 complex subunit beta